MPSSNQTAQGSRHYCLLTLLGSLFLFLMLSRLAASAISGTVLSATSEDNAEAFDIQLPDSLLSTLYWAMTLLNAWSALGVQTERLYQTSKEILGLNDTGTDITTQPHRGQGRQYAIAQASNLIYGGLNGLGNYYSMSLLISSSGLAITLGSGYGLISANFGYRFIKDHFSTSVHASIQNTHPKTATAVLGLGIVTQLSVYYFFLSRILKTASLEDLAQKAIAITISILTVPSMYVSQVDKCRMLVSELLTPRLHPLPEINPLITHKMKRAAIALNYTVFKVGELLTILNYISSNWSFFRKLLGTDNLAEKIILGILALPTGLAGSIIYISNNMVKAEENINHVINHFTMTSCNRSVARCTPFSDAMEEPLVSSMFSPVNEA